MKEWVIKSEINCRQSQKYKQNRETKMRKIWAVFSCETIGFG